ncbi:MAG: ATPase domain-containing protein [Nitrososphaeraceae archaeon]|nr:ATPase domain-containing protein [Nitrososphaeraceae archaeon]
MTIPGLAELTDGEENISPTLFLLSGPPGIGKRDYCREFLEEGLSSRKKCIFLSSKVTDKEKFELLNIDGKKFNSLLVNPVLLYDTPNQKPLDVALDRITSFLSDIQIDASKDQNYSTSLDANNIVYFVMDSLNHFCDIFEVDSVRRFLTKLVLQLKKTKAIGIFTIDSPVSSEYHPIVSFCDGIMEMKFEESNDSLIRKIRLLSMAGHAMSEPTWIQFNIDKNGRFTFADDLLKCTLDGRVIQHPPVYYLDLPFHAEGCARTYRKFMSVFKDLDPKYEILMNYHFCFIDIVGLSNPELAVHRQKEKIVRLNEFISSCNSFRKISDELKIILPAGDGMAIGYENNPELPYKLSVELHVYLRKYNKRMEPENRIKVRIGLSSGPVFTVYDISNRLNVWGPGIIMARRVMDLGDSWHILITENFAMQLRPLYEEYRNNIRLIGPYEIKHGEKINVYSAYSDDYGNPELPEKFKQICTSP